MALITCKDCKKEFSTDAKKCPHCGANKPPGKGCLLTTLAFCGFLGWACIQDGVKPTADTGCNRNWKLCKDNADLINHYGNLTAELSVQCKDAAEHAARFGTPEFPWLAFGSFRKGKKYVETGVVEAIEPDAKFQNGFGAMVHSTAICTYDLNLKKAVDIKILPNE